jgi:hypothetical protein
VTLSTDDEGIERIDLSHEYQKAELQYGIPYQILKDIARNNLMYGFVGGQSLWQDFNYQHVVTACEQDSLGSNTLSPQCSAYLKANKKAELQWQLENRFNLFEAEIAKKHA